MDYECRSHQVCVLPQNVVADSRVVSFYSNATVYQSVPINPTLNAEVQNPLMLLRVCRKTSKITRVGHGLQSAASLAAYLSRSASGDAPPSDHAHQRHHM